MYIYFDQCLEAHMYKVFSRISYTKPMISIWYMWDTEHMPRAQYQIEAR